ncbi:SCY1-like protein 2 isoform X2 [Artemia franciscana]|uniref:Protein kinase domain-containing protein n=1 Tax=Artemia franciscana TaxID=6661 RepID=A0AA88IEC1_ARTSF|nr:hypothetical protein QYM36_004220 [Artemia franciscana]
MFSRFKHNSSNILNKNPLDQHFEMGRLIGSAGPGNSWRIYEAYRRSDGKEFSIFLFDKRGCDRIHRLKKKDTLSDILRKGVKELARCRHPRFLQVVHGSEECQDTLAFVSEPVIGSLANLISQEDEDKPPLSPSVHMHSAAISDTTYTFLDIEYKYGILQIVEALAFLHTTARTQHRNICPSSILVTRKGTWKLAGLEFSERPNDTEASDLVSCPRWTSKITKSAQPELDFIAPETQTRSMASFASDMFSVGLLIATIYNRGQSPIQANHSSQTYIRLIDTFNEIIRDAIKPVPLGLQDAVLRLTYIDPRRRPTAQHMGAIQYFSADPAVGALQYLDLLPMKDPGQKAQFFRSTLCDVFILVPKKLWFQHMWPSLEQELKTQEVLAAALQPVLFLIRECSTDEYQLYMLSTIRQLLSAPKSIQATVTLLENLHVVMEKSGSEDIQNDVLPLIYQGLESTTQQIQSAALVAAANASYLFDEATIRKTVLPRAKAVLEKNSSEPKLVMNVLACISELIDRLDKSAIIDDVLPLLWEVKPIHADVLLELIGIYKRMLSDKKYGLSINVMATRVLPALLPHVVNPTLVLEQFTALMEVLREMLEQIDRHQRNRLRLDALSSTSPERIRPLKHQLSSDNMIAPMMNVPSVMIDNRKTCSEENFARNQNNYSGPSSPDSSSLRVSPPATSSLRRLSDNSLTPGQKNGRSNISGSTLSPSSCLSINALPERRHSSVGNDRRPSTTSTLFSSIPAISNNIPNPASSVGSALNLGSRRPSMCPPTSGSASSLLQQIGSGVSQLFAGK